MNDYDNDGNGILQYKDFVGIYAINFYKNYQRRELPENISLSIDEIFNRYDHDRNGSLDFNELT